MVKFPMKRRNCLRMLFDMRFFSEDIEDLTLGSFASWRAIHLEWCS